MRLAEAVARLVGRAAVRERGERRRIAGHPGQDGRQRSGARVREDEPVAGEGRPPAPPAAATAGDRGRPRRGGAPRRCPERRPRRGCRGDGPRRRRRRRGTSPATPPPGRSRGSRRQRRTRPPRGGRGTRRRRRCRPPAGSRRARRPSRPPHRRPTRQPGARRAPPPPPCRPRRPPCRGGPAPARISRRWSPRRARRRTPRTPPRRACECSSSRSTWLDPSGTWLPRAARRPARPSDNRSRAQRHPASRRTRFTSTSQLQVLNFRPDGPANAI